MGATTTQGTGPGSAEGNQKGSERMTLGIKKLIGPRVMAAGSATLVGTTAAVEFPALTGAVTDYVVLLTSGGSTYAYVSSALAANSGDWTFTITAGSNAVVAWAVVAKGV